MSSGIRLLFIAFLVLVANAGPEPKPNPKPQWGGFSSGFGRPFPSLGFPRYGEIPFFLKISLVEIIGFFLNNRCYT